MLEVDERHAKLTKMQAFKICEELQRMKASQSFALVTLTQALAIFLGSLPKEKRKAVIDGVTGALQTAVDEMMGEGTIAPFPEVPGD